MAHNCTLPEDNKEKSGHDNNWRNLILISEAHPRTSEIFQSKMDIDSERQRHLNSKYKFMIHPFSKFRINYDIYFLFASIISSLVCVEVMTIHPYETLTRIYVTAFAILHCSDVILCFFTGRIKENKDDVELNPKKVCMMYLKSTFIIDFIFGFAILFVNWFADQDEGCDVILKVLVFLNVFSIPLKIEKFMLTMEYFSIRIKSFYSCIFGSLYYWWMVHMWTNYDIMVTKYVMHFKYSDEKFRNESLAFKYDFAHMDNFNRALKGHVDYFFLSMTMNIFKYGIWFEKIICVFAILITSFAHLFMVLLILLYFLSKSESRTKFDSLINQVESYAEDKKLPKPIKDRIIQFYKYKFRNRYFNEANIMSMSCDGLVEDMHKHICRKVLKIPLFSTLTQQQIGLILKYFEIELYMPNDIIYNYGSIVEYIFFISSGTVAAYTMSGIEAFHLEDGDFFGWVDVYGGAVRRETTINALEITEIFKIRYQHAFDHFNNFPEILRSMHIESTKRSLIIQDLEKKFKENIMKNRFNSVTEKRNTMVVVD
ncbi:unnamed protein product [Brassicogethes aeneus]|uniref:Cyclic nucleotide-binding domain-containing protein n=1 Tax=Brassicogethes aeneus TaxID=1431903 RepID=A0A9P0B376_BRAAE|nr:unnamed protein product [Brassicogethes aeneus]